MNDIIDKNSFAICFRLSKQWNFDSEPKIQVDIRRRIFGFSFSAIDLPHIDK